MQATLQVFKIIITLYNMLLGVPDVVTINVYCITNNSQLCPNKNAIYVRFIPQNLFIFAEVTSIRSGLRKRKRPESPQSTDPQVSEEWVDEDKLELWEIKQYGERLVYHLFCARKILSF